MMYSIPLENVLLSGESSEEKIARLFSGILHELYSYHGPHGKFVDWKNDANLKDTPNRVAKALIEMTRGINPKELEFLNVTFPCDSNNMVVVKNLDFSGLCPHHFLPVEYKADLAYIPDGRALGLSKFHRIVSLLGAQPILQESLGKNIAETIKSFVYTRPTKRQGIIVRLNGIHSCMRLRGTKCPNSEVSTTYIHGKAFEDAALRQEFYESLGGNRVR